MRHTPRAKPSKFPSISTRPAESDRSSEGGDAGSPVFQKLDPPAASRRALTSRAPLSRGRGPAGLIGLYMRARRRKNKRLCARAPPRRINLVQGVRRERAYRRPRSIKSRPLRPARVHLQRPRADFQIRRPRGSRGEAGTRRRVLDCARGELPPAGDDKNRRRSGCECHAGVWDAALRAICRWEGGGICSVVCIGEMVEKVVV